MFCHLRARFPLDCEKRRGQERGFGEIEVSCEENFILLNVKIKFLYNFSFDVVPIASSFTLVLFILAECTFEKRRRHSFDRQLGWASLH